MADEKRIAEAFGKEGLKKYRELFNLSHLVESGDSLTQSQKRVLQRNLSREKREKYSAARRRKTQLTNMELWEKIRARVLELDELARLPETSPYEVRRALAAMRMLEERYPEQVRKLRIVMAKTPYEISQESYKRSKDWKKKNPDEASAQQVKANKVWREKNPEHWAEKNKEYCRRYRQRKKLEKLQKKEK